MVYDKDLANRVVKFLPKNELISERRMFGSLAFLYQNNMICGVMEDGLMARVGPSFYEEALNMEYASEMDLTGRTMKNIVLVSIDGLDEDSSLQFWIGKCMEFVSTLPPKVKRVKEKKISSKRSVL